jgi:surface protein
MKFNNETIRYAVKEWLENEELVETKYGHISSWDTSGVTDMSNMFKYAESFNQPLNDWDVSNVTDMNAMFSLVSSFNQPLNDWDVSNVTNMNGMFDEATSFNQPLNDWDVSNVTDMNDMFKGASSFNQPLNDWDVSNVTQMSSMFSEASSFNQIIGDWDVSNVNYMNEMFSEASSFNQPLNDWDVSNVTNMKNIFSGAESFNQNTNKWKINSLKDNDTNIGENVEEADLEINLMYEGTLFTYINDNEEEMTFKAFRLVVECPDADDYEWEVKDALGELVFTTKGDSKETYLNTDLPEDIVDYQFTISGGNLHDEALNSIEEAVDIIKNLKTISFKEINPKDGESICYID